MNEKIRRKTLKDLPLGGFRYFEKVGSTNDIALQWGEEGGRDLSIVLANEQTTGRGRSGRIWHTPPDSALAFSLLLLPNTREKKNIPLFTGLGALALVTTLKEHYRINAQIKWPNDVLINEKKTAGILVESNWLGDNAQSIVLGMGVNIYKASVPQNALFPATSVEDALALQGKDSRQYPFLREEVLRQTLIEIINLRPRLGSGELLDAWEENLAFRGRQVQIHARGGESITGKIMGINKDGSLRLDTVKSVHFGDISLRPLL